MRSFLFTLAMTVLPGASDAFSQVPTPVTRFTQCPGSGSIGTRSTSQGPPHLPSSTALSSFFLLEPIARSMGLVSTTGITQQQSGMEIGIRTAQILLDPRRRDELKSNIKQRYPFVPNDILDTCIELTAKSFTSVAPRELKDALKPGGMEKLRPHIQATMVSTLLEQPFVRDIPILSKSDKTKVVSSLVDQALDYVLRDAQEVLASPEVRLESLEAQRAKIFQEMGRRRVFVYRVRHNPKLVLSLTGIVITSAVLYWQRETALVTALASYVTFVSSKVAAGSSFLAHKIAVAASFIWVHVSALAKYAFAKISLGASFLFAKARDLLGIPAAQPPVRRRIFFRSH